jgi:crotonobetainyl-CoA:carnitine CoA-transferase CaiB-like acyl-CoA transferase
MFESSKLPLEGLRIIDLADEKGVFCSKLFADLGADVIKVERPEGDASRNISPFMNDDPHFEKSLYFAYNNTNKRSITLNLDTINGRNIFKKLILNADVLVETYQPGYMTSLGLGYADLNKLNPGLIVTSITGFGQTGPYKNYKSPDIVSYAMGGLMYLTGDPDMPPLLAGGLQTYYLASLFAADATQIALYARDSLGQGQHIDISMQECIASIIEILYFYQGDGYIHKRIGGRHHSACPSDNYPCKDGYWAICLGPHSTIWVRFITWLINDGADVGELGGIEYEDGYQRQAVVDTMVDPVINKWAINHTKAEIFEKGQEYSVPVAPMSTVEEVIKDPNLIFRNFFNEISHPVIGKASYPGIPWPVPENIRRAMPAPLLGQHNQEVYGSLGYTEDELISFKETGVI